ncbi:hypothetical protein ACRDNQ_04075 [Palleronia sp. KMU-117]|uniref:hypothetical protein n=1 Tax=Palleronia sp. KMU-117 TaxID=3434108 RepID=UPI003D73D809
MSFIKSALKAIAITLVVIITLITLVALAIPSEDAVQESVNGLYETVATDFAAQYELTKQHGSPLDRCLAAQQVAAAYLQANSTAQYAEWKSIEGVECSRAGLNF